MKGLPRNPGQGVQRGNWTALIAAGIILASQGLAQAPTDSGSSQLALLTRYCFGCHNEKLKIGGISLESLDPANVGEHTDGWEKVLRKLRSGEMPPAGLPRPDASTGTSFTQWLESSLDREAGAHPNPGRPAIHRLNRVEYSNAIRDLLDLDVNPGSSLPGDDSGYGFDNIGDVLSVSPMLLERYIQVARMISRLAVGDTAIKPGAEVFAAPKDPPAASPRPLRNVRVSDDLPFDSRGGLAVRYYFPVDGEYIIRAKLNNEADTDHPYEVRLPVKAGARIVGVTFLRESAELEVVAGAARRGAPPEPAAEAKPSIIWPMDLRLDGARVKLLDVPSNTVPQLNSIQILGPYNIQGPGNTASRARIFVCRATAASQEEPCARRILTTLARNAYRRPVADADVSPLMGFYQRGRADGGFEHGIEMALRAMLISPNFLFRIERDPRGTTPGGAYPVSDLALASRLSFFLWSSIPDDELLTVAENGKLRDPAVLAQQVRRMIEDRRSTSLISNFTGQWLYLRNVDLVRPDIDAFPEFDETLRQALRTETEMFFEALLRENRGVPELLDANFTFLNETLAKHYGIPNIYGGQFRRVTLDDSNRGGLLGQGSILTVTSYPNRTSVVQRGKWILENLLGSPPPPPPADVPELKPHGKDGKPLTLRQQMEQHRANATCASCHARMDPLGFALENYDGIGRWRAKDAGAVIDASGKMPDGTQFDGPAGLKKVLLSRREEFVETFTQKMLTYALGRGLEYYDQPAIRSIMREASRDDYPMQAVVTAIVNSAPFQMRRSPEQ